MTHRRGRWPKCVLLPLWLLITFADAPLTAGQPIRSVHVTQLRTALDEARAAAVLGGLSYTDPTITGGVTTMKGAHIIELRNGVQ